MNQPSNLQRCEALFSSLEIYGAGLHALGDLIRHSEEQFLDESIMDGIGCLVMTVSNAILAASTEGYQYTRQKQIQANPPEAT